MSKSTYRRRQLAEYEQRKATRKRALRQLEERGMTGRELDAMHCAMKRIQRRDSRLVFERTPS